MKLGKWAFSLVMQLPCFIAEDPMILVKLRTRLESVILYLIESSREIVKVAKVLVKIIINSDDQTFPLYITCHMFCFVANSSFSVE